jgi:hypothetical protein
LLDGRTIFLGPEAEQSLVHLILFPHATAGPGTGFCLKLAIVVACAINALQPSSFPQRRDQMAKKRKRKYSRGSGEEVRREMHRYKRGSAKSGRGGKGGKVKSRKQAIAIALSKARKKGKKVPRKKR